MAKIQSDKSYLVLADFGRGREGVWRGGVFDTIADATGQWKYEMSWEGAPKFVGLVKLKVVDGEVAAAVIRRNKRRAK